MGHSPSIPITPNGSSPSASPSPWGTGTHEDELLEEWRQPGCFSSSSKCFTVALRAIQRYLQMCIAQKDSKRETTLDIKGSKWSLVSQTFRSLSTSLWNRSNWSQLSCNYHFYVSNHIITNIYWAPGNKALSQVFYIHHMSGRIDNLLKVTQLVSQGENSNPGPSQAKADAFPSASYLCRCHST